MSQLTLSDLNACSAADFVAALGNVFEHSPWIAEQAAAARPFAALRQLYEAMTAAVDRAPPAARLALIKAHPDLADKTQRAAGLTAESNAEQHSAGLDRLSDAEYEAFERVNNAYRTKFGFPYIVCVRRHTRDSILRDFERRLPNDAATEVATSVAEICRIAALRLDQQVASPDRLPVHDRGPQVDGVGTQLAVDEGVRGARRRGGAVRGWGGGAMGRRSRRGTAIVESVEGVG